MMARFFIICLTFLMISCSQGSCCHSIDVGIDLFIENNTGNDLLDPLIQNSYNNQNIRLYYVNQNMEKVYVCGNYDSPYGYSFFKNENKNVMRIFPNYNQQQNGSNPITYIQWNDTDRDTLQCEIDRSGDGSTIYCKKVWYNNELVWNNNGLRQITVVKN